MLTFLAFAIVIKGQSAALSSAPISLRQAYMSWSDFCIAVGKQSGLKLTVRKDLEDRNAMIECKDRPASEVLAMFAETFNGRWAEQNGALRFDLAPSMRDEERIAAKAEEDRVRDGLSWFIHRLATLAGETPDVRAQNKQTVGKEYEQLSGVSEHDPKMVEAIANVEVYRDPLYLKIGGLVNGHETDVIDALVEGRHVLGLTIPAPDVLAVSPDFFLRPGRQSPMIDPASGGVVALGYHPGNETFEEMERSSLGTSIQGRGMQWMPLSSAPPKLEKLLTGWAAKTEQSVMVHAVQANDAKPSTPYGVKNLSAADELIDLSDRSGLPVIGDGLRLQDFKLSWLPGATVSDWIAQFNAKRLDRAHTAYFRSSGGWLLYRHPRYWRYFDTEIPERLLVPMEKKQASVGLNLDDFVQFAASLTRKEANWIGKSLLCFPAAPIADHYDGLLFMAGLTPDQKTQMRSNLNVLSLSAEQRYPLREVFLDSGPASTSMLVEVITGGGPGSKVTGVLNEKPGIPYPWKDEQSVGAPVRGQATSILLFAGARFDNVMLQFALPTAPG